MYTTTGIYYSFLDYSMPCWLDSTPTSTTDSHLNRIISIVVLYIRLYLLMMGLDTP